jgi:hypothetical protein
MGLCNVRQLQHEDEKEDDDLTLRTRMQLILPNSICIMLLYPKLLNEQILVYSVRSPDRHS